MPEFNLELKPINDLLDKSFIVPSYQRGYRWTSLQVKELLDDIWEFHKKENKTKNEFYCLQPIVVKSNDGDEWELIDGQQRITTIFIILKYLKEIIALFNKRSFTLKYETRDSSNEFLNNIDFQKEKENIDYFHICNAFKVIKEWFEKKDSSAKMHFFTTLLNPVEEGKNVKVIWYEVDEDIDAIDIFTRINVGKIPLNNAELIRALFLRESNFKAQESTLKQVQIATEWDTIEHQLQQDSFWLFIYDGIKPYPTRIEYIFDLMQDKKSDYEDYFTFHAFNKELEDKKRISALWLRVKQFYQSFRDWYNNTELYHLIGYLITTGTSILEILKESEGTSKTAFKDYLKKKICLTVNVQISELEYNDKSVKKVLLLFNVITIVNNRNSNIRFPFDSYKKEKWDIEHIRSVKSDMPIGNRQKEWLKMVLDYFTGLKIEINGTNMVDYDVAFDSDESKIISSIRMLLSGGVSNVEFIKVYEELLTHFKEDKEPENINNISNLALLDAGTNRSYKNAFFPIKRSTILKNDMEGSFVPICTRNAFLKAYSKKLKNVMYWQEEDSSDYLSAIQQCLIEYLPSQLNIYSNAGK